jgi:hypothetical protein
MSSLFPDLVLGAESRKPVHETTMDSRSGEETSRAGADLAASPDRALWTSANVNVCDNLPNGPHLKIHNAIELLASDTPLTPSRAETMLSACERYIAYFERQLSYLHADALCHRPALTCYRVEIFRHDVLPGPLIACPSCLVAPVNC